MTPGRFGNMNHMSTFYTHVGRLSCNSSAQKIGSEPSVSCNLSATSELLGFEIPMPGTLDGANVFRPFQSQTKGRRSQAPFVHLADGKIGQHFVTAWGHEVLASWKASRSQNQPGFFQ